MLEFAANFHSDALRVRLLGSAITCLFANVRTTAPSSVLEQALDLIKGVVGEISDDVQSSIYREAKSNLDNSDIPSAKTTGGSFNDAEPLAKSTGVTNELKSLPEMMNFWSSLAILLFGSERSATYASGTERLREHKVELASKLSVSELLDTRARETLLATLAMWLAEEHSRSLRTKLERTITALR